jgi:hypothetical protein
MDLDAHYRWGALRELSLEHLVVAPVRVMSVLVVLVELAQVEQLVIAASDDSVVETVERLHPFLPATKQGNRQYRGRAEIELQQ